MTVAATPRLRIAPGVVHADNAPVLLGVRPYGDVDNVWEAQFDDRNGTPLQTILTEGPKVVRFIERYCVHTQARWTGKPFRLLPWQKGLLCELFEVVWNDERGRYVRRYHDALIGVPKKNGKSELLAGIGLYLFVASGEPTPVIVAAAANETSAKLVFTPMKTMVEVPGADDPSLGEVCDSFDTQIFLRGVPNAEIRKVPASPRATEGLNIFANLLDEWHEWTSEAAVQTSTKLLNGTVLREDYLNIRTTTPGHDVESLCGQDYDFGVAVAAGEVDAAEWFFRWYAAPREVERDGKIVELDWRSEEAVRLANPSYGALQQWPFYAKKLRRAVESIYRRYFLGQWTETEDAWLPTGSWEACEDPELELEAGWPTAVGWDAATKHDSTALVVAQRQERTNADGEPMPARIVTRAWIWERPLDPETRKPVEGWLMPIEEVKAELAKILADYRPASIEFDPAFISWEAAALAGAGYPMREFSQASVTKLSQASQSLFELVIDGTIAHDGDVRFTRHVKSAVARQTSSGSAAWLLVKGKARKKMDAAVALSMAVWGLKHPPEVTKPKGAPTLYLPDED